MNNDEFRMVPGSTSGVVAVAARSRHTFARHTHEQFGIGVITSGGQRWHSGGRQVEAGAGPAIAVNPGEVHDGAPVGDAGRAWRMLYFEPAVLEAAVGDVFERDVRQFEFRTPVFDDARVTALVRQLFAVEVEGGSDTMRPEELLLALAARAGGYRPCSRCGGSPAIAVVKEAIDDSPASRRTLAELARMGGISRFQLLRGFVRVAGMPPHAYLVQRRIDLVRRLIRSGASLAEAATASGFADQSHMTRTFVRKYGLSPGAYAKALH
jgi:AraC-like DNA-binding protein/quercetin dioxygenase-like cupin family protein